MKKQVEPYIQADGIVFGYEVTDAPYDTLWKKNQVLDELLAEGWEPFATSDIGKGYTTRVLLRRPVRYIPEDSEQE